MSRYLLDSDCVIDALKGIVATLMLLRDLTRQGDDLCSCDVAVAEVYSGLRPDERSEAAAFLDALEFLPTSRVAAEQAGTWRWSFARQGISLSTTDCLIAAVALDHQAAVLTGNVRDFPMPEIVTVAVPRTRRP